MAGFKSERRRQKPMMERKRRARINKSLEHLKDVIVDNNGGILPRLDKARILELTVECLRKKSGCKDNGEDRFKAGYMRCVNEVTSFLHDKVDDVKLTQIVQHLFTLTSHVKHSVAPHKQKCPDVQPAPCSVRIHSNQIGSHPQGFQMSVCDTEQGFSGGSVGQKNKNINQISPADARVSSSNISKIYRNRALISNGTSTISKRFDKSHFDSSSDDSDFAETEIKQEPIDFTSTADKYLYLNEHRTQQFPIHTSVCSSSARSASFSCSMDDSSDDEIPVLQGGSCRLHKQRADDILRGSRLGLSNMNINNNDVSDSDVSSGISEVFHVDQEVSEEANDVEHLRAESLRADNSQFNGASPVWRPW